MRILALPLLVLASIHIILAGKPAPIIFVIQSQPGAFHSSLAQKSEDSILAQWKKYVPEHVMEPPQILQTHKMEAATAYGAWTFFPLIEVLASHMRVEEDIEWVAILEENTRVDLRNLNIAVEKYRLDAIGESLFLGRGIRDSGSTIVHHFDHEELLYPDTESGIFLSRKLVLELDQELKNKEHGEFFPKDFNIDPAYEFAKYLYRNGNGVSLTHIDEICTKKISDKKCFTFSKQETSCLKSSQVPEMKSVLDVSLVAVKTCSKFHSTRVKVVQDTWGPLVPDIEYVSDEVDPSLPSLVLPFTVNTESGHCNKTMAILQHFLEKEDKHLLVIVDDDTILSVARLAGLLYCYMEEEEPVVLGQRYGYGVASGRGYSYITGGGGMIFNRAAVSLLSSCPCPSEDTPDDMHIGMCARRAGIPTLHSGRMFQARPTDYPSAQLAYRKPVSFHKHWEIDPIKVYQDYFEKADSKLSAKSKDEL